MSLPDGTVWRIEPRPGDAANGQTTLVPPLSKSDAQRALVLAHILGKPEWISPWQAEPAADVRATQAGLARLREPGEGPFDLDCGDGGAPFRFLLGQAAVAEGKRSRLWGTPRLGERPHGPLIESLRQALGTSGLEMKLGQFWPVEVRGAIGPALQPRFLVNAEESSQFVTSLLFAAAALCSRENRPWTVELLGPSASLGYLDLTFEWMKRAGFSVAQAPSALVVKKEGPPLEHVSIPGDWSSLGYLLLLGWKTGASIAAVDLQAAHPDKAVVRILQTAGLEVTFNTGGMAQVRGSLRSGISASGAECPDLLPTLAALACLAPSRSRFTEVDILRGKESDRLNGVIDLVTAFGGRARYTNGALELEPFSDARLPALARVDSRGDHRMAMSAAVLSVLSGIPLELKNPECVAKSFPHFWEQLGRLGVACTPSPISC